MQQAEFDKFADEYRATHQRNIRLSGEAPEYFAEYKIRDVVAALRADSEPSALAPEILDFGAGIGTSVPFFRAHLPEATLTCIDVSRKSLAIGSERFGEAATFVHFDGASIPYPDASFDIAFAACVFHHIDHRLHLGLFREIGRVLRPAGAFFVFEHNPLNPLTVQAVRSCAFDVNARLIGGGTMKRRLAEAGFERAKLRYRVFFPHALARLRWMEDHLAALPFGAQYCVMARKP
jgi:ubiquinone/menaquinone biosynthesis C-methylase UbiE